MQNKLRAYIYDSVETVSDHEPNSKQKVYLETEIQRQGPVIRDTYPIVSVFTGVSVEMMLVPVQQRAFTRSYTVEGLYE